MKTNNTPTETVKTTPTATNPINLTKEPIPDSAQSRLTAKRLHEYGKRHNLTADAQNLVSYLFINGPANSLQIMEATGLEHHKFFAALCVANGILIMDKRAITVDVNLTSRYAINHIPESAFAPKVAIAPPVEAPVATVGPRPSAGDAGGELTPPVPKVDPAPVATNPDLDNDPIIRPSVISDPS